MPSLHADGQRHSIAFTVTLLTDADGTVAGIAAVARDETERWNQEQELRRLAHAAADASNTASSHRPSRSSDLTPEPNPITAPTTDPPTRQ